MLDAELEQYEIKIQHYEHQYEQELTAFNSEIYKTNSSYQVCRLNILMHLVKTYVYQHTSILICQIRYKESCCHVKLSRHQHRHLLSTQKYIDVYPQVIVDVAKVLLNWKQLDYLSRTGKLRILLYSNRDNESGFYTLLIPFFFFNKGPNYIRPNQSYLYSHKRRQEQLKQEHNNIMNVIIPYLIHVHHISITLPIVKQFTQQMETYLQQRYMASLSYRDIYRTRKELELIKSIESRLKKGKYILRVTDKSGIFHIGHAKDYEQKAEAYLQKTGAYVELESYP
jgi:hypothetical protein